MSKHEEDGIGRPAAGIGVMACALALAWLIPGAGFLFGRRWLRGAALFLVINATFAIGLAMDGGIVWPSWDIHDQSFNIIYNLIFIVQLGCGLPTLASLYAAKHSIAPFLVADPSHALFDLSNLYLFIAGAMNYFAVCNTFDRLFGTLEAHEDAAESAGLGQEA